MEPKNERMERAELTDAALDEVAGGIMEPCLTRTTCGYTKKLETVSDCGMVKIKPKDLNGELLAASRLYCKGCCRFFYRGKLNGLTVYYDDNFERV